jgi:hypothetical protein
VSIAYPLVGTIVGLIVFFIPSKNGKVSTAGLVLYAVGIFWLIYGCLGKAVHF